jgi:hypothetical protein
MYTSMLDIDRLQENVDRVNEGACLPRRAGKTTALLCLLLGDVELGDPNNVYLFVSPTSVASKLVQNDFLEMADEHELHCNYHKSFGRVVFDHGPTVFFVAFDQFLAADIFRGMRICRVFLDVTSQQLCREDSRGGLDYPISILMAGGADFV